jgi:esterase/lipase superfamily enzyme
MHDFKPLELGDSEMVAKVYFATNRNPNRKKAPDDFGSGFSKDGHSNLRFGMADVSGKGLGDISIKVGSLELKYDMYVAQEKMKADPDLKIEDAPGSVLGSNNIFKRVREKMIQHSRDTIVFIHGYNVSFKEALASAARLKLNFSKDNNGPGANVVVFSWPSNGSMMPFVAYGSDRDDAEASGPAFARGLLKLSDFLRGSTPQEACNQRLHLVAHSMGNYVLRHTLQKFLERSSGPPARLFDQVFLMAADEDDDAFEYGYKLKHLPRFAKRVNVYYNNKDIAMAISDRTKGNPDRLGDNGPRAMDNIPSKVSVIDVTPVGDGLLDHSYYLTSQIVVDDMQQVLMGKPNYEISGRMYIEEKNLYRLTYERTQGYAV